MITTHRHGRPSSPPPTSPLLPSALGFTVYLPILHPLQPAPELAPRMFLRLSLRGQHRHHPQQRLPDAHRPDASNPPDTTASSLTYLEPQYRPASKYPLPTVPMPHLTATSPSYTEGYLWIRQR